MAKGGLWPLLVIQFAIAETKYPYFLAIKSTRLKQLIYIRVPHLEIC
jgi:hypothetical protein